MSEKAAKEKIVKYLSRSLLLDIEIENKEKELAELKKDPGRLQGVGFEGHIRSGEIRDPVSSVYDKVNNLEVQINIEINRLIDLKKHIHDLIETVEDDVYRIILQKKYIHGDNEKKIGDCIGYSERQIYRLHDLALEKICGVIQSCQQMSLNVRDNADKI